MKLQKGKKSQFPIVCVCAFFFLFLFFNFINLTLLIHLIIWIFEKRKIKIVLPSWCSSTFQTFSTAPRFLRGNGVFFLIFPLKPHPQTFASLRHDFFESAEPEPPQAITNQMDGTRYVNEWFICPIFRFENYELCWTPHSDFKAARRFDCSWHRNELRRYRGCHCKLATLLFASLRVFWLLLILVFRWWF